MAESKQMIVSQDWQKKMPLCKTTRTDYCPKSVAIDTSGKRERQRNNYSDKQTNY